MNLPRVVVAGTHSGCGKSSVALGLLRALRRRGMIAQPFKVGPDFVDPSLLTAAAGRACGTLDSWLLPHPTVLELLARASEAASVAVIEGMMGLYDGWGPAGDLGSTAEVARLLGAPIVLVVDASTAMRSAAAAALGFAAFDPQLTIAGVIADRAGGTREMQVLRDVLQSSGIALLGSIPRDERLQLPNPDLAGSVAASHAEDAVEALADAVVAHVDVEKILHAARTAPPVLLSGPPSFPAMAAPASARIGLARDDAFAFHYQAALEILEASGARLVPFSPIRDRALPPVDGLYISARTLEPYAEELSDNGAMRASVAEAMRSGMPVFAEGDGIFYLMRRFVDRQGRSHEMAGVLPGSARAHGRTAAYNAVTLQAERDTLLLWSGESLRGYEVPHATVDPEGESLAFRSEGGAGIASGRDGITSSTLLATCAHVHFAAYPAMVARLVAACQRYKTGNREPGTGNGDPRRQ